MTKEEIKRVLDLSYEYNEIATNEGPLHQSRIDFILEGLKEQQSPLPFDIDEAAEESMPEEEGFLETDIYGGSKAVYSREQMLAMFKAGAELMTGQGYTLEGIARPDDCEVWVNLTSTDIKDGDKVIVQIRKKQKP